MNTLIFGDKNALEIIPYTVSFLDRLIPPETIITPVVSVQVFSGTDLDPDSMLVAPATVNAAGNAILFNLQGGIPGVIYLIVIAATISSTNLYIKVGHLAVVASDPFASV